MIHTNNKVASIDKRAIRVIEDIVSNNPEKYTDLLIEFYKRLIGTYNKNINTLSPEEKSCTDRLTSLLEELAEENPDKYGIMLVENYLSLSRRYNNFCDFNAVNNCISMAVEFLDNKMQNNPSVSSALLSKCHLKMAEMLIEKSDLEGAEKYCKLIINAQKGDNSYASIVMIIKAYITLGKIYDNKEDFDNGVACYKSVFEYADKLPEDDEEKTNYYLYDTFRYMLWIKRNPLLDADELNNRLITHATRLAQINPDKYNKLCADIYSKEGYHYKKSGDYEHALESYKKAEKLLLPYKDDNLIKLYDIYCYTIKTALADDRIDYAEEYLSKITELINSKLKADKSFDYISKTWHIYEKFYFSFYKKGNIEKANECFKLIEDFICNETIEKERRDALLARRFLLCCRYGNR